MTFCNSHHVNNIDPSYAIELARWGILRSKKPHLKGLGETLLSYTTLYLLSPRLPMLPHAVAVALQDLQSARADAQAREQSQAM